MDLFQKLMLAKQISFTEGKIELLKQRMVFYPPNLISLYLVNINNDPRLTSKLYLSTKKSMVLHGFGSNVGKEYKFNFNDYASWFVNLAKLAGWGKISWKEVDYVKKYGVIDVYDSPVAVTSINKLKRPCDHILRGFFAGGGTTAFKKDVDAIEIKCSAVGDDVCRFIIDSKDALESKFPEVVKQQIG